MARTARRPAPSRRASPPKRASAAAPAVFEALAAYVSTPSDQIDVERVTDLYGLTSAQLAETAGLNRVTLQKTVRREAPKTQSRLREMLEILARVEAWAGGRMQALAWYRAEPIPALGGRTAEAMVKSGQATMVRDYLDHIAMGGFA
ncbi:MAG TPA: antitoxin Xre/MbcA/ParS toxin-binding domain-containing protein [Caulobacteraceae bacterium]|jgi:lambda repressor-like predicted transcriptional regulator|nr:antitoxin Xre/MbcA/ParS toxin-binding domain-containing protein [Caulobacteraceae bacterium]